MPNAKQAMAALSDPTRGAIFEQLSHGPKSVGEMRLTSRDPSAPPRIRLNFFDEPSDVASMVAGVRVVRELIAAAALAPFIGAELFPGPALQDDDVLATTIPSAAAASRGRAVPRSSGSGSASRRS